MASPFIKNKRVCVIATTRNDAGFSLDQRDANPYRILRMLIAVIQPSSHIQIAASFDFIQHIIAVIQAP